MKPIVYKISVCDTGIKVECSDGWTNICQDASVLTGLLLEPSNEVVQFLWDIDRSLAPALALMGESNCRKLVETTRLYYKPCCLTMFYLPGKIFGIKQGRLKGEFYDLAQYFPEDNPQTVQDMQVLAEKLFSAVAEIGILPQRWTSPARFMKDCILRKMDLPNGLDTNIIPDDVGELAWLSASKLWTEAHQVGHFKKIFDYDISAAFPTEACKMLDPRCLKWVHSEDDPPKEAQLGYINGRVTINHPISPVIKRTENGDLFSPIGEWNDIIPLSVARFIDYWGIGTVRVTNAWYGLPIDQKYPMFDVMKDLYKKRMEVSPLAASIIKRMMASFYGLTLQSNADGTFGDFFLSLWGEGMSTRVTLRVADFIYRNKIVPVHIGVDGVLTEQEVKLPAEKGMGCWRLASTEPAIVMGSGLLYQGDKHPSSLYYKEVLEMLETKPNATKYEKQVKQAVTLQQALATSFSNLGKEMPMSSHLYIKPPRDRSYHPFAKTGKDILTQHWGSQPLRILEKDTF